MSIRTLQLVVHYDGTGFSGWQRQLDRRTVQGVIEAALSRLCDTPRAAMGSGRTDAGVHARGQAVGVRVPLRWTAPALRRALNAVLPHDVWVASAHAMRDDFHARHSAVTYTTLPDCTCRAALIGISRRTTLTYGHRLSQVRPSPASRDPAPT